MKKIFTILLLMPLLWACSSSSDDKELDKALVGTWYLNEYKADLDITPIEAVEPIEKYIIEDYEPITLEFKANGDVIMTNIKEQEVDKAKAWTKGDFLYMKYEGEVQAVKYSVIGDVLETRYDVKAQIIEDLKYIFRKGGIPENLKINKAIEVSVFKSI